MATAMSLNALLSNSPILAYHFLMLLRPVALLHFWAKSTVILMVQEPLFLWCKNRYSCDARTVILVIQEPLFLWCKNSYFCDARTTVVISPFFYCLGHILDTSFAYFSLFFRSFRHVLKKIAVMDTYGHLWTVMDTLAFCDFVSLLCVKWGIWGPCTPISITTLITNSQYVGTSGRTRITWYRQLKINYIKTITI